MPAAQQIEDMTDDFNAGYHKASDTVDNMDRTYYLDMIDQLVASLAHLARVGSTLPQTPAASPSIPATAGPTERPSASATIAASATPSPTPSPTPIAPTMPPPVTTEPTLTATGLPRTPTASVGATTPTAAGTTTTPPEHTVYLPLLPRGSR